jgi:hypothetical protein
MTPENDGDGDGNAAGQQQQQQQQAELKHYQLLFQTLVDFSPSAAAIVPSLLSATNTTTTTTGGKSSSSARSNRRFSTNDVIGTDDQLFFVNDPELGNNLFADDDYVEDSIGGRGGGLEEGEGICF